MKVAKARTRTSRAGERAHRAGGAPGFTLLELIVVLAIVAMVIALVPGLMLRRQPGLDVEVAARALADGLRQTRSQAMVGNRDEVFSLDVEERLFRAGRDQPLKQLDRALELHLYTAKAELLDAQTGRIRFFPDGSSTGGAIGLQLGEQQSRVSVDWLTGHVAIEHAEP
jgi:general secretion pathway protein H